MWKNKFQFCFFWFLLLHSLIVLMLPAARKGRRKTSNRPLFLLRWVESLDVGPVVDASNINELFRDGLYLIKILQRLCPNQKFIGVRWRPRSEASCIANLELSLSFIWRKSVRASKMSSASDLYRTTTSEKWLYVLNIVFEAFVLRELKASFRETLIWYQTLLSPFGLSLSYFNQNSNDNYNNYNNNNNNNNNSINNISLNTTLLGTHNYSINNSINNSIMNTSSDNTTNNSVYTRTCTTREARNKQYLKSGLYEDFSDCVKLFCIVDTYCRSIEKAGGIVIPNRPNSTSVYKHPSSPEEKMSNAHIVFEELGQLGVPLFWTAEEWIEYQDIGFMIFQLGLIKAAFSVPVPPITSMSELSEDEVSCIVWKDDGRSDERDYGECASIIVEKERSLHRASQMQASLVDSAVLEVEEVTQTDSPDNSNNYDLKDTSRNPRVRYAEHSIDSYVQPKERRSQSLVVTSPTFRRLNNPDPYYEHTSPLDERDRERDTINPSKPTRQGYVEHDRYNDDRIVQAEMLDDNSNNNREPSDYEDANDAIESILNLSHPDGYVAHLLAPVEMCVNIRLMGVVNTLTGPTLGENAVLRLIDTSSMLEYYVGLLEIKNVSVTKSSVILSSGSADFAVGSNCIIIDFEGQEAAEDSQDFAKDLSRVLSEAYTIHMGRTK